MNIELKQKIQAIAISHQKQMHSTHPHAIIETIEDAIVEALETLPSQLLKQRDEMREFLQNILLVVSDSDFPQTLISADEIKKLIESTNR